MDWNKLFAYLAYVAMDKDYLPLEDEEMTEEFWDEFCAEFEKKFGMTTDEAQDY